MNTIKNITVSSAPEPNELKWANLGISSQNKIKYILLSTLWNFFIIIILAGSLLLVNLLTNKISFIFMPITAVILMLIYSIVINKLAKYKSIHLFIIFFII